MADNWAASKISSDKSSSQNDDEWADFGGFESAPPSDNPFADATTAQAFPWATAFPASTEQSSVATATPIRPVQASPGSAFTSTFNAHGTPPLSQNLNTPPAVSTPGNPGNLFITPTIETTTQSSPLNFQGDNTVQNNFGGPVIQSSSHVALSSQMKPGTTVSQPQESNSNELMEIQKKLEDSAQKVTHYEHKLEESETKLSLAEREKLRLQQEMEDIKKQYKEKEDVCKEQNVEIEKQKKQYDELQHKHEYQIKALREAGQESFALIVEEYKELAKTAVAQQQELSEKRLHEVLEEERDKFTVFMDQQNENMKLLLKEEQEKNMKKLEDALDEQKTQHQAELKNSLEEERSRAQEAVEKAVEEERQRSKEQMQESLSDQKRDFEAFIEEQKKTLEESLDEERRTMEKLIEKTLKDEQEKNKNDIEEVLAVQRQTSREAVEVAKEKTKEEMMNYVKDKEKADDVARQRAYQSMDLFLRGVQSQLNSLINNTGDDQPTPTL